MVTGEEGAEQRNIIFEWNQERWFLFTAVHQFVFSFIFHWLGFLFGVSIIFLVSLIK